MRKAGYDGFSKVLVKRFHTAQTTEAVLLASRLMDNPAEWDKHCGRAASSMILSAVYNYPTIVSERDPTVEAINDCAERLTRAAYPGAHLVEFFTWMRYIQAGESCQCIVVNQLINHTKKAWQSGSETLRMLSRMIPKCLKVSFILLRQTSYVYF